MRTMRIHTYLMSGVNWWWVFQLLDVNLVNFNRVQVKLLFIFLPLVLWVWLLVNILISHLPVQREMLLKFNLLRCPHSKTSSLREEFVFVEMVFSMLLKLGWVPYMRWLPQRFHLNRFLKLNVYLHSISIRNFLVCQALRTGNIPGFFWLRISITYWNILIQIFNVLFISVLFLWQFLVSRHDEAAHQILSLLFIIHVPIVAFAH